jgi:hypothetical protein
MPNRAPKEIETKLVRILNSWETLAPAKSFAGLTLEQYRDLLTPCLTARRQIEELDDQRKQAIDTRDALDALVLGKAQQIINGVLADSSEGSNSSLYAAMGYTRKSDRKSGLTRKSHRTPQPAV